MEKELKNTIRDMGENLANIKYLTEKKYIPKREMKKAIDKQVELLSLIHSISEELNR